MISGTVVSQEFVIGIDGGGTYCRAMLQDADGNIMGTGDAGPANIMTNAPLALASIVRACENAIAHATTRVKREIALTDVSVVAGLAGANIPKAKSSFLSLSHPFAHLDVISDLHAACLGAHKGADGVLVICGTGSAGTVYRNGRFTDKGGYGLTVGDNASAAWLGQSAVKYALLAFDNIEEKSVLFEKLLSHLSVNSPQQLIQMLSGFTADAYGKLAPIVITSADDGCEKSRGLLFEGAGYLIALTKALLHESEDKTVDNKKAALPICMVGGLAHIYRPFLEDAFSRRLCNPHSDAQQGAIDFLRNNQCVEPA